jgi:PAS domain S-box-containing protein
VEIPRLNELGAALSQINQAIIRAQTREQLFSQVCQIVVERGQFKVAWVDWLDAASKLLTPTAKAGDEAGAVTAEFVNRCQCGLAVVQSGLPCVINDLTMVPCPAQCLNMTETLGLSACAAYPVRMQNQLCGVLTVGTSEAHTLNGVEKSFLEDVTLNISFALDKFVAEDRRRAAESAMNEGEQLLNSVLRSGLDGFYLVGAHGKLLQVNDAYCAMSGYTRPELLQMSVADVECGESPEEVAEHIRKIIRQGRDRFESFHRRKNGQIINIESSVTFQEIDGGRFFCFLRDITERKRAEQALRESEERFRLVVEGAPVGILIQADGVFRYLNPTALAMFGADTADQIVGHAIAERVHPENCDAITERIRLLKEEEELTTLPFLEEQLVRLDGTVFVVEATAIRFIFEGRKGSIVFIHDITERKRAQEELQRNEEHLTQAVGVAALGIFERNHDPDELYCSLRLRNIFGWSPSETVTMAALIGRVLPEDRDILRAGIRLAIDPSGEGLSLSEYRIVRPDGIRWVSVRVQSFFEGEGNLRHPVRTVGAVQDITERKRAENEIRALEQQFLQSQKMEAVGRLAGGIAHDFNNLLMVIQSYTEMLQDGLSIHDNLRDNTEQILKAANQAASLTRQLLAFSRKQVLSLVVLDLNEVVSEAVKMLKRLIGEDVELRVNAAESLWAVKADSDHFSQVLMNLCVNARDAMLQGGVLTIETRNFTTSKQFLEEHPDVPPGDYVLLSVTDTGTGISKAVQKQIFEPFFTTKERGKGTGLGLSTVFGIVNQSGGHVWVDSEPGHGASFTVCLPSVKDARAVASSAKTERVPRGTETLLVVEDENALREAVCDYLRSLGYTLLAADSGRQALAIERQHEGVIHVLITDVVLPGMGGRELAQKLTGLRTDLKTIYMSGYIDDAVLQDGVRGEGVALLQKPFSLVTLARKVREMIGS